MRRAAVIGLLLLLAVGGCGRVEAVRAQWQDPPALGGYELCAFATDAVHQIVKELWSAPDEVALIPQTVTSYRRFAARLRELEVRAAPQGTRERIELAAVAADDYAADVARLQTYHVSVDPVVYATRDAFPGCDVD